jgi:hypothetical protein
MKLPSLILSLSLLCCQTEAALIYSNMGTNNDNFSPDTGHTIQVTASSYAAFAMGFNTGDTSYLLNELQLPLLNLTSTNNNLTINLCADTGAGPGAVVATLSVDSPIFPNSAPFSITTLDFATQPLLSANTTYWITLQPSQFGPGLYSWALLASVPQPQLAAFAFNPSAPTPPPWVITTAASAFAVYGTPVPEPSASALAILGMAGLFVAYGTRIKTGSGMKSEITKA